MDLIETLNIKKSKSHQGQLLRLIERFFWIEKLYFYTADLTRWQPPPLPRMRTKAEFGFGNKDDVISLTSNPNLDALDCQTLYLQKLQAGNKLLIGKHEGEIVFYLWLVSDHKGLMNKILVLHEHQVAIERGFTRKEFRGHGFFVFGMSYLFPELIASGVTYCLTEIATHNVPMIRTAIKLGFQKSGSYYYWLNTPFKQYAVPRNIDHTIISAIKGR